MSEELADTLKEVIKKDLPEDVRRRIIGHYDKYLCKILYIIYDISVNYLFIVSNHFTFKFQW